MVSGTLHRRGQQVAEWLAGWLLLSRRIETACSESDGGLLLDPRLIPREKVARGEGRMSLAGTWLGRLTLGRWSIDQIIHQWTGWHSCAIEHRDWGVGEKTGVNIASSRECWDGAELSHRTDHPALERVCRTQEPCIRLLTLKSSPIILHRHHH